MIGDAQLPPLLARWITDHGGQAVHIVNLDLLQANDQAIWQKAMAEDWIVISKDADFLHHAQQADDRGKLLWVRIGNCRTRNLLDRFEASWAQIHAAFDHGQRIVELR